MKKAQYKKEKIFFINNIDKNYFYIYNKTISNGAADGKAQELFGSSESVCERTSGRAPTI